MEGPGSAAPRHPERDKELECREGTEDEEAGGSMRKKKVKQHIGERDEGRDGGSSGSGGHNPGGDHEAGRSQLPELEAREEGIGGCQGLGVSIGEDEDEALQS